MADTQGTALMSRWPVRLGPLGYALMALQAILRWSGKVGASVI